MTTKQPVLEDLPANLRRDCLPKHIAVIMDGNGRWAQQKGLPRIMGHRRGVDTLKAILRCCRDWGIQALTVYAFSTENWGRSLEEVDFLMTLFEQVIQRELKELMKEDVRLTFVGNIGALSPSLQAEIERSVNQTQFNQGIQLTVATNYGGRQEILQACQTIATEVQAGNIQPQDITEGLFESYLYTAGLSDPDLVIRTSGEMRISNFLLWQIAYAEIYVTDTLWPDFKRADLCKALDAYQARNRRFGRVKNP